MPVEAENTSHMSIDAFHWPVWFLNIPNINTSIPIACCKDVFSERTVLNIVDSVIFCSWSLHLELRLIRFYIPESDRLIV